VNAVPAKPRAADVAFLQYTSHHRIHVVVTPPIQADGHHWTPAMRLRATARQAMLDALDEPDSGAHPLTTARSVNSSDNAHFRTAKNCPTAQLPIFFAPDAITIEPFIADRVEILKGPSAGRSVCSQTSAWDPTPC